MEKPNSEAEDSEDSHCDEEVQHETSSSEEDEEGETGNEEESKNVEVEGSSKEDLDGCEESEEESLEADEVVDLPDPSTKEEKPTKGLSSEHALVPVTTETASQALALRNRKEWDDFVRKAKTKMPIGLNELYTSNKQELFGIWLDQGRD